MTTAKLFRLFGGREVVMSVSGVSRQAANHWLRNGVPYRHWPALRAAAEEAGIPGITDAALASTRPDWRRVQRAAE
jgi:hypothetical protein